MEIEVKATIEKASITPLHGLIGRANAAPVAVDGIAYEAIRLIFRGFRGRINMKSRRYDGAFFFETVGDVKLSAPLGDCCDFAAHGLGQRVEPENIPVEDTETSDGTDSDTDGDLDVRDDAGQQDEQLHE